MDQRDWSNSLTSTEPTYYSKYGNTPANNSNMSLYGYGGDKTPQMTSAGKRIYSGTEGTFSQEKDINKPEYFGQGGSEAQKDTSMGGTWTSGQSGPQISDLPGYLKMKEQQKSGADFSGYQNQLQGLLSDPSKIQQTPGYQFDIEQGNQAINRSAAAKGMGSSGGILAELAKYGQGMASKEYGTQVNRLQDLMRGSQQFGLESGYYKPEQYTPSLGIQQTGGGGGYRPAAPRPAAPIDYNSPMGYVATA